MGLFIYPSTTKEGEERHTGTDLEINGGQPCGMCWGEAGDVPSRTGGTLAFIWFFFSCLRSSHPLQAGSLPAVGSTAAQGSAAEQMLKPDGCVRRGVFIPSIKVFERNQYQNIPAQERGPSIVGGERSTSQWLFGNEYNPGREV